MKKILSIFILMLSVFLLASCELNSLFTTTSKKTSKSTTSKTTTSSEVVNSSTSKTTKATSNTTNSTNNTTKSSSSKSSSQTTTGEQGEGKFSGRTVDSVIIYSINDTHGQLADGNGEYVSLARVDAAYNYLDNKYGYKGIRVMNGDLFQGSFVSRFTYGRCMIEGLNACDFDVMVLGNHEFDWGLDVVEQYFDGDESNGEANFPLLCCNIINKTTGQRPDWIKPYTIINYYGISVGIIGAIGQDLENTIADSSRGDYEFTEELPLVKEYSAELHNLGCDVIIYSCHDFADNGTTFQTIASSLSPEEYVDCFLAGHMHSNESEYYRRNDGYLIPLIECKTKNASIGEINLEYDGNKVTNGTILHYTKESTCFKDSTPTEDVLAVIDKYQSIIDQGNQFVYRLNKNLYGKQAIGDYMMDAMISYINNNVNLTGVAGVYAFLNNGGIRVSSQAAGDLTFADIYEWFPFDNKVSYVKMTGAQLVNYVNSYSSSNTFTSTYSEFAIDDNKTYILATSDYCRKYLTRFGTVVDIDIIMYNMLRDYFLSLSQ